MADKQTMQALAAAGRKLRVEPESFVITMGELRGIVTEITTTSEEAGNKLRSKLEVYWIVDSESKAEVYNRALASLAQEAISIKKLVEDKYGDDASFDFLGSERA